MKEYTCPYCDKKLNAGNAYKHTPICSLIYENKDDILSMYASGSSVRGICKQYGYNINSVRLMMQTYGVVMRTSSESSILSHERYRDHYRHTTESKAKLREKRISWMKANPDKTAWRTRNAPSYPEKLFIELCETHLLYDKYDIIREYSVYPYYIDFAFLNAKVAIEIDGSQHWLDKTRIDADMKKDELLKNNGWRIMRIPEFKLKIAYTSVVEDVLAFLDDAECLDKRYISDIIDYEHIKNIRNQQHELKRIQRENKRQELIAKRKIEFDSIYPIFGWSIILGKKWNMTSQSAARYCNKYFNVVDGHMSITKDELLECTNNRMTINNIAKKFKVNASTIISYRKKYGIKSCTSPQLPFDWEDIDLVSLMDRYSMSEIARQLGVTPTTVRNRAVKQNIITKSK